MWASARLVGDDGEVWEGRALCVAVANAKSYGAGLIIAPLADIRDGLLDVVIVEAMSKLAFMRSFPLLLNGRINTHRRVHSLRGTEVHIETSEPSPVLVDGDIKTRTPMTVALLAEEAKLWLPGPG